LNVVGLRQWIAFNVKPGRIGMCPNYSDATFLETPGVSPRNQCSTNADKTLMLHRGTMSELGKATIKKFLGPIFDEMDRCGRRIELSAKIRNHGNEGT
jgi:hypothetical protein